MPYAPRITLSRLIWLCSKLLLQPTQQLFNCAIPIACPAALLGRSNLLRRQALRSGADVLPNHIVNPLLDRIRPSYRRVVVSR